MNNHELSKYESQKMIHDKLTLLDTNTNHRIFERINGFEYESNIGLSLYYSIKYKLRDKVLDEGTWQVRSYIKDELGS